MVLLNDVVEVLTTSNHNVLPHRMFSAQQAQRPVTCRIAIKIHLKGPVRLVCLQGLAKEGSRGCLGAIRTQQ
jgi:hypothetical protein